MSKDVPLETQTVLCSLLVLKECGIEQEQFSKMEHLFKDFWEALYAYRMSKKPKEWTTRILRGIASGQATFDRGPEWVRLNEVLNEIWEAANG